jgi:hypothetical protein
MIDDPRGGMLAVVDDEQDARTLREATIAFVSAGVRVEPAKGLLVEAMAKARRAVAGYLVRREGR